MSKLGEIFDKINSWLIALAGILFAAFLYQRNRAQNAEAKVINSEYDKSDALTSEKVENLGVKKQEAKAEAEKEKAAKPDEEALKKFLEDIQD